MRKYRVLREHLGDKPYAEGHVRDADEVHVTHLVRAGVLKEMTDDEVAAHLAEHPEPEKQPDGDGDAKAEGPEKGGEGAADTKAETPEKGAAEFRRTKAQTAPAGDDTVTGAGA